MRASQLVPLIAALFLPGVQASDVQGRSLAPTLSSVFGKRQAQCVDLCMSDSDIAALQTFASCGSDLNCLCAAVEQLSQACLFCILEIDGIDVSTVQSACGASASVGGAANTGTGTAKPTDAPTSTDSLASTTDTFIPQTTSAAGINISICDGVCSSASDAAASKDVLSCESQDPTCICNAMSKLSRACFFCMLQVAGISESAFESLCAAELSTTAPSSTAGNTNSLGALTGASTLVAPNGVATGSGTQSGASGSPTHSAGLAERLGVQGMILASLGVVLGLALVMG
ncbi:hypothetical protein CALVIDRAFT_539729 [Calocera viscosa TUFC12733]|uniref:Extracellular membrane protein CFEM domain-containing protein n=1 Tax=Calocera viscosa (strain TUFC12733) TaxID=1330018 RepID=A0A167JR87_CALVF|nr:hypothetical protein CALVIDRAFT_539729 [Calocera viscosa TUFC12733]